MSSHMPAHYDAITLWRHGPGAQDGHTHVRRKALGG